MLVSTNTAPFNKYGNHFEIVKLLKDAGFDAFDMTIRTSTVFLQWLMDIREDMNVLTKEQVRALEEKGDSRLMDIPTAIKLREYADSIGIKCNQTHAPFPTARLNKEGFNEYAFEEICTAIKISGILGAKICIVHPCNDYSPEENAKIYNALKQTAIESGVKIALENMWNWDTQNNHAAPAACSDEQNFMQHLELLDPNVFCACVDLGHAEMLGLNTSAVKMIKTLGKRVECLHIHDNNKVDDNHTLPYVMNIEFEPIWAALKEIGYEGDITFEVDTFQKNFPNELMPAVAEFMCQTAKYIKSKVQKG